ncbi:hypothetical protein ACFLTA_02430 [Bacteroidota bacterium]
MTTTNGPSSQVKNSNQEEKSQAAMQLFREFISNFNDPDPGTNRQILSEILTAGLKHRPHPTDEEYSDIACRLSEAIRDLLNGWIDNGLDDQVRCPGQAEEGSLKYDYSELDKFLSKEHFEKETITYSFHKLIQGYMKMATYILYLAPGGMNGWLTLGADSADFVEEYIEIFRILERLPENNPEIPDQDPTMDQEKDISSMGIKYGVPEEEVRDMIRRNRMHRAFIKLEKDMPDHIENLDRIFREFKKNDPKEDINTILPEEKTYKMLLEYLERWVQYRSKLWPEEGGTHV